MPDDEADAAQRTATADASLSADSLSLIPSLANHRRLVILYGSQSGCAAELASRLALDAFHHRFPWSGITVLPLDAFDASLLPSTPLLLIVTSTQGQGEPPDNARRFYRLLMRRGLPSSLLSHLHYSVFGLGDSSYPIFNAVARRLHQRLQEVGAVSICRRGLGDDQEADGGVEKGWEEWRAELWRQLRLKLGWLSQLRDDDIDRTRWPPSKFIVELEEEEEEEEGGARERKEASTAAEAQQAKQEERKDAAPQEESAAQQWCNDPWSILPVPPSLLSSSALPVALPPVSLPPFGSGSNRYLPFPALLTHNTRLTPQSHFQDVRHLRFALPASLPASSASPQSSTPLSSLLSFEPGDVVEIFPRNDPAVVSAFITSVLGLSPHSVVRISLRPTEEEDEATEATEQELSLPSRCSLQCLFELHLDMCGTPKASFFSLLALHAADAMQREKLQDWGSTADGRADLFAYCERERRTYAEVLTEFWSARPPLSLLISSIPRLQPRAFSISSSHRRYPQHLDVTAAILQFETRWKRRRTGLCSRFLQLLPHTPHQQPAAAEAEQGALHDDVSIGPPLPHAVYLPIFIRRGAISMPKELGWGGRPVVMVGPGTGVAPFRAMCQHKQAVLLEAQGEAETEAAPAASSSSASLLPSLSRPPYSPFLLLFGCRYRAADFLYASEWQRFHSSSPQVLSHPVLTAFSRDQAEKVYVQDVIRNEEVSRLLYDWLVLRSGCLFIAGSSGAMPREVRRAVVHIIAECGGLTAEQAAETVRQMEKEKRYIQDTW